MASPAITGSRTYNGQTATLQAQVPGMPGIPPNLVAVMEEKRRAAAADAAMRLRLQQAQLDAMRQSTTQQRRGEARQRNPASERSPQQVITEDQRWAGARNEALTPVTGFNMGGGYTVDPNKLPPSLRPASATMGAMPASGARLTGPPPGAPVVPAGPDERPDWLGTGSTNPGEQAAVLRRNAAVREAQQQAMLQSQR